MSDNVTETLLLYDVIDDARQLAQRGIEVRFAGKTGRQYSDRRVVIVAADADAEVHVLAKRGPRREPRHVMIVSAAGTIRKTAPGLGEVAVHIAEVLCA